MQPTVGSLQMIESGVDSRWLSNSHVVLGVGRLEGWVLCLGWFGVGGQGPGHGCKRPIFPVGIGTGGSVSSDSLLHVLLSRAEVTEERLDGGRRTR